MILPAVSKRINTLKITENSINIMQVNVYLLSSDNTNNLDEYSKVLQEVKCICNNLPNHKLIFGGDWNVVPLRNDSGTKYFESFIINKKLYNCLGYDISNFTYTFIYTKNGTTYTLDNFLYHPTQLAQQLVRNTEFS